MTPNDLRAWRRKRTLSQRELALLLHLSKSIIERYERGIIPIPYTVELALKGLEK